MMALSTHHDGTLPKDFSDFASKLLQPTCSSQTHELELDRALSPLWAEEALVHDLAASQLLNAATKMQDLRNSGESPSPPGS